MWWWLNFLHSLRIWTEYVHTRCIIWSYTVQYDTEPAVQYILQYGYYTYGYRVRSSIRFRHARTLLTYVQKRKSTTVRPTTYHVPRMIPPSTAPLPSWRPSFTNDENNKIKVESNHQKRVWMTVFPPHPHRSPPLSWFSPVLQSAGFWRSGLKLRTKY